MTTSKSKPGDRGTCTWSLDDEDMGTWSTGCVNLFYLSNDHTPKGNGMGFCCYCGGVLIEATPCPE